MEHPLGLRDGGGAAEDGFAANPWPAFTDHAGWTALVVRAAEPNPFAERWFLKSGLEAFDPHAKVLLGHYRAGNATAGIVPLARSLRYDRYPIPHLGNWLHANAFLGAPLVAEGHEHGFWSGLLDWADAHAGAAMFLHLAAMPAEGPLHAALRDVCASQRRAAAVVHRIERALLRSDLSPEAYFDASMTGKKRKELRRQFNRLSEEGELAFERHEDAEGLEGWIADFLALERAGWKGTDGSALACEPAKVRFFSESLAGAAAAGRLERLAIRLDGRPIAMLANFITPPGAYSFKTAYDERLGRFSPGVLLQRENLSLLARRGVAWTDSCAAPDHPMIERIWREKRAVVRISIAIGGRARRSAAALLFRAETGAALQGL